MNFEKGCYPGQEPIARQHYRGRVNRSLRVLSIEGGELPDYDAELVYEGKTVGRVTSSSQGRRSRRRARATCESKSRRTPFSSSETAP